MEKLTRVIEILDVYAVGGIITEVYARGGTLIYKGAAMSTPYHICKCYARDHFFDEKQLIIKIEL